MFFVVMLSYLLLVECGIEMSFVMEFIDYVKVIAEQLLVYVFVKPQISCKWNTKFERYDYLSAVYD